LVWERLKVVESSQSFTGVNVGRAGSLNYVPNEDKTLKAHL